MCGRKLIRRGAFKRAGSANDNARSDVNNQMSRGIMHQRQKSASTVSSGRGGAGRGELSGAFSIAISRNVARASPFLPWQWHIMKASAMCASLQRRPCLFIFAARHFARRNRATAEMPGWRRNNRAELRALSALAKLPISAH